MDETELAQVILVWRGRVGLCPLIVNNPGSGKFKMVFSALDEAFFFHASQFSGKARPFQIEIVGKLLTVKWDIKFAGLFLQRYRVQIRKNSFSGTLWRSVEASSGECQIFLCTDFQKIASQRSVP